MHTHTHTHAHLHAQRRALSIIAVGALLALIALMSVVNVAADVPDTAAALDTSNSKANRDVLEGLDATRYAQPPPATTQPGILGVYYPFYQLNPTAVTFASPTPPPFSGTQNDNSYTRANDRG